MSTTSVPLHAQSGSNTDSRLWTAGYQGLFKVTLKLDDAEREIDVDDRGARVYFILEMQDTASFGLNVLVEKVDLEVQFDTKNISVDGKSSGIVPVIQATEPEADRTLKPTTQLTRELLVQTGVFSTSARDKAPAHPGTHTMDVKITYKMVLPDTGNQTITKYATMVFLVAED